MGKKHRTYTAEFRDQAMQLLDSTDKPAAEIERDLGITPGLLTRWKRKAEGRGRYAKQAAQASELTSAELENQQLKRENAILRQERDILKINGPDASGVIFGNSPNR